MSNSVREEKPSLVSSQVKWGHNAICAQGFASWDSERMDFYSLLNIIFHTQLFHYSLFSKKKAPLTYSVWRIWGLCDQTCGWKRHVAPV